jgi:uncharacterized membrane protein
VLEERRARAGAADETDFPASVPVAVPVTEPPAGPLTAGTAVFQRPPAAPSVWRDPVVWTVAALAFGAYLVMSLYRFLRLSPSSWDLGIYTEYVKQLSLLHVPVDDVRGPGFNLLGDHFQIGLAVLAPFFRVFPSPVTLLFFQALLTALSVFPVAAAATALTGRTSGRLVGFAYAFSWGLQQMIDFDFHEIALAVPLLAFALSALVRRRPAAVIAWAAPLVFVKEDQGFTVAAIGLLMGVTAAFPPDLARGWRSRLPYPGAGDRWGDGRLALWGGVALMAWGLLWSVLAITVIIPHFNPQHTYAYWDVGGVVGGNHSFSVGGLAGQLGTGWPTKLETVVLLLLPTAFAALGSPVALLGVPSLVLRFISTSSVYWGTDWHYNATIMPILFIAASEAIARTRGGPLLTRSAFTSSFARTAVIRRPGIPGRGAAWLAAVWRARPALEFLDPALEVVRAARVAVARHGAPMMAAIAVALAFQFPLSNLWQGATYHLDAHVAAANAAMAVVPDGATVQTNLDLLAPLAARTDTFWIGNPGNPRTQYIVFDGADSGYSPAPANVPAFIKTLYPHAGYVQVFDRGDVYVFRLG